MNLSPSAHSPVHRSLHSPVHRSVSRLRRVPEIRKRSTSADTRRGFTTADEDLVSRPWRAVYKLGGFSVRKRSPGRGLGEGVYAP